MRYIYNIKVNKEINYTIVSKAPIKQKNTFDNYLTNKGHNPKKIKTEIKLIKIKG